MSNLLLRLLAAPFIAAAVTAALLAYMLKRGGAALPLDHPNERSLHLAPVPRSGGIAVLLGCVCGWIALVPDLPATLWIGLAILFGVSLLDDLRNLGVAWRLASHLAAAALVAVTALHPWHPLWLLLAVFAIAWMTNLYNFMDGSDGLAGGMALIGFGCYGVAAWLGGDGGFAMVNWVICAAALAFLAFNFHPARIFLGDSGSIPLGYLAGALGLLGWQRQLWPLWFPVAVFSPFIFDASITLAKRLLRREKVWEAHRDHYYQRLVRLGWGHRKTALAEYALMLACGAAALGARALPVAAQAGTVLALLLAYALLAAWIEYAWNQGGSGP